MAKQTLSQNLELAVREESANCKNFDFTVSAELMKKETARAAQAFAGYVAVPGFRRGKAPAAMIAKRYEKELKDELKRIFTGAAFERLTDGEKYDVVMSDMAANTTGNKDVDHIRTSALVEEAFNFSLKILN